ncbi:MAG TPA: hypothetical protein VH186_29435 [Chloroflexia bacterium]|nr:hypothetical protein [Chloroflexia bacterium]
MSLALLLCALGLTACGTDTATPASVSGSAPATAAPTAASAAAVTTAPTTPVGAASTKQLRNLRYCEVIPLYQESGGLEQYVYNTQGLNDCPADAWKALNANDLAKSLGAVKVFLNGPRYWMMDQIIASGNSASGEIKSFGDLKMQLRAKIEVPAGSAGASGAPYTENIVERNTDYLFSSGKPTFQLVSPGGDVYIMQTYSQIIDPKLSMEDLPNLGSHLKLPAGWQFRVVTPDQDLHLVAKGKAFLIQDDLTNSYQKVTR